MNRGRPLGSSGTCAACGAHGHYKSTCPEWEPTKTGSRSEQAAQFYLATRCTLSEAASEFGLTVHAVHAAKQRLLRPRNGGR